MSDKPSATNLKRSIVIDGHKTSISLEGDFWESLWREAERQTVALGELVKQARAAFPDASNLSSAVRLFVLHAERQQRKAA